MYQTRYEEEVFLFKILLTPFPFASLVMTYRLNRSPALPFAFFLRLRLSSQRLQFLTNFRPIPNFKALLTEPGQRGGISEYLCFVGITLLARYLSHSIYRGYYTVARRNEFYFRMAKQYFIFYERAQLFRKILFLPRENKIYLSSRRAMFFLLYRQTKNR